VVSVAESGSTVRAVVRHLEGETADVEVESGGCGRCHEEGGCGGLQLTQMFCKGPKNYRVDNKIGAVIGDRVIVAIAPGSVRQTANLAYGVPLIASIAGAVVGGAIYDDPGAIVGATLGLMGALVYVRFYSASRTGKFSQRPYIVSRS
jgi:sigma-E factor negative regulatory protein RseC